jgi:hypothetical protein
MVREVGRREAAAPIVLGGNGVDRAPVAGQKGASGATGTVGVVTVGAAKDVADEILPTRDRGGRPRPDAVLSAASTAGAAGFGGATARPTRTTSWAAGHDADRSAASGRAEQRRQQQPAKEVCAFYGMSHSHSDLT